MPDFDSCQFIFIRMAYIIDRLVSICADLVTRDAGLHVLYVSFYANVITKFAGMDSLPNLFSHGTTLGHARSSAKNCKGWQAAHVHRRESFQNLLHSSPVRRIQWRGWQQESKKNSRFNKQNNNFVRASHVFVHFFPLFAPLRRENAFFRVL